MTDAPGWPDEARRDARPTLARMIRDATNWGGPVSDWFAEADRMFAEAAGALAPYHAAALKAAYQRGWNDRESDLLAAITAAMKKKTP